MNILSLVRSRFATALAPLADAAQLSAPELAELVDMVRPSQDAKFGDYQANCAMPLGKRLGRPPREIAQQIVDRLEWDDLGERPEVAGPGFINLRLHTDWLAQHTAVAVYDERLGVAKVASPRSYVVDFSAPNVAKPMHVGHIRSTVIGDSLYRTLKFAGHRVVGDNHVGDWGTQFGMIIYGFRHFRDEAAYREHPVDELGRLYRLVNRLVDYHEGRGKLAGLLEQVVRDQAGLERHAAQAIAGDPQAEKKAQKDLKRLERALDESRKELKSLEEKQEAIEKDPALARLATEHANIAEAVLAETAKLHSGDPENLRLWREFMPPCMAAIEEVYRRLGVKFDCTLGESFYHDRLADVVDGLLERGIARESEGAICIFFDDMAVPMIVRKRDGAYLYATTDLATIQYRMENKAWSPDALLYVVDHRQGDHFRQLFAAARRMGYRDVELQHVAFGTVLGSDGRPFKTRSGDTVGLMGLLDDAVAHAYRVVCEVDEQKPQGGELSEDDRRQVAEVIGLSAIKYADLSQNRTSDYEFSFEKMVALKGNTATYMQYAYARVLSIFRRGGIDIDEVRGRRPKILLGQPAERALALALLQFSEAIDFVLADYRPNQLTAYLFELANRFSTFFEECPVLKAEATELRDSRLLMCDLTARTIKQGLELLGIDVVGKM
ncbi:MAG TPA: arginine--tRNA ligase [Pirellulales bacterium]|nr:arginine--tRNA ligase [Pirellulales bacterium]